jgi:hypothetical protein
VAYIYLQYPNRMPHRTGGPDLPDSQNRVFHNLPCAEVERVSILRCGSFARERTALLKGMASAVPPTDRPSFNFVASKPQEDMHAKGAYRPCPFARMSSRDEQNNLSY